MNAVLMCIFIVPVAVAFWLSAFAAGFDWSQWVKLAADTANRAASDPAKALGTVQTYWGHSQLLPAGGVQSDVQV